MKILNVDDEPQARRALRIALVARGFEVDDAMSGEEAIERLRVQRPDVVLLAILLPGISGVEAIRRIRVRHPQALFVVLTTYEGDEDIYQALEAGARAYVIKGMPHEVLVDALRRVLAGGRFLPSPVSRARAQRSGRDARQSEAAFAHDASARPFAALPTAAGARDQTCGVGMCACLHRLPHTH